MRVGRSPGFCARCRPQHQHRSSSFSTAPSPHHFSPCAASVGQTERRREKERRHGFVLQLSHMIKQHQNLTQVRRATKRGASAFAASVGFLDKCGAYVFVILCFCYPMSRFRGGSFIVKNVKFIVLQSHAAVFGVQFLTLFLWGR